jgi:hypothetical protein
VRRVLLELGTALQQLFTSFVGYVERFVWKIGHEWSDSWFFVLVAAALVAAWWSLGRRFGRHEG